MDLTNFWYSSGAAGGGGGGGDPGDPIGRSLRFRGGQRLVGTPVRVPAGDFTLSFWLKRGDNNSEPGMMSLFIGTPNYGFQLGNSNQTPPWRMFTRRVAGLQLSNGSLTDYSAWYHCVFSTTGGNTTFYLNGETQLTTASPASANTVVIGSNAEGKQDDALRAYLADYYCIDGQALLPTAFGRENDDGVWVPREVDFTPAEMRFSDFVTTANGGGWFSGREPDKMFNPSTTSGEGETMVNSNGDAIVFRPVPAIDFTSSVEVYTNMSNSGSGTIYLNDPTESGAGTTTQQATYVSIATGSGTIEEIRITSGIERANCCGIRVDGVQLLNPYLWSVNLFTVPSQDAVPTTGTNTNFAANDPANLAFDGNTSTHATASEGTGSWLVWTPDTDITATNSVRVHTGGYGNIGVNNISTNESASDLLDITERWVDVSSHLTFPVEISSIAVRGFVGSYNALINAIEIDGQIYVDGTNPSYGTNGFHLDFADPNDLGADRSGNNNDFTATGFNTDPVGIFSNNLTAPGGTTDANNAFTDDNSFTETNVSGEVMTFDPNPNITFVNGLEIAIRGTDGVQWQLNGSGTWTSIDGSNSSRDFVEIASGAGTLETLQLRQTGSSQQPGLFNIRINGTTILTNNTGTDYDVMQDSPTQNWATFNPLDFNPPTSTGHGGRSPNPRLYDANLTFQASQTAGYANYTTYSSITTQGVSSGQYYFEATRNAPSSQSGITANNSWLCGMSTSIPPTGSPMSGSTFNWASVENLCIFDGFRGIATQYGSTYQEPQTPPDPNNAGTFDQVIGYAFDLDSTTDNVRIFVDGVLCNTMSFDSQGLTMLPVVWGAYDFEFFLNLGQKPFIQTPPAGFEALQTQNMPAAPIANGRDHFEAITWAGNDVDDRSIITTEEFAPGLVWIKCRTANSTNHLIYDTVRGAPNRLFPNLANEEDAGSNNLKSFTSNGFTLGTNGNVNGTGNDYVAWCWRAGGAAVTNNDGSIESQVSANTDAGFSIVTYTGGGDGSTVGHGLTEAPDFILFKAREAVGGTNQNWNVYSRAVGAGNAGFLNLSNAFTLDDFLNQSAPNNTVIEFGTSNSVSALNTDYIAYCWHSVPGYSAFGSYTGNGQASPNSPFIYLGFKPAFLMIKCATAGTAGVNHWFIHDTTRAVSNPSTNPLAADVAAGEFNFSSALIDLVSNGFKLRGGTDQMNGNQTYIYAAFAENPFQAPVTAR